MTGARITIECKVCGDNLSTGDVEKVTAFDREHTESCGESA